tara:strand:+ start:14879 stop:15061 length:183 start_codon:yes stop_codon:yes gene_type:complete
MSALRPSIAASRALRHAANELTSACVRFTGQRDAPELHEPVPEDMAAMLARIDKKTGGNA